MVQKLLQHDRPDYTTDRRAADCQAEGGAAVMWQATGDYRQGGTNDHGHTDTKENALREQDLVVLRSERAHEDGD